MKTLRILPALLGMTLILLSCPPAASPGEFTVTPIRLDFDSEVKTGVITIATEDAEKLNLQMKAYEWTEDADGKDVYNETTDLVFFPRIMTLSKDEQKTLRAGIKIPPQDKEKTYRLFIEEIPSPKKAEGVNVSIVIRFGVPVFVKPVREEARGEIQKLGVSNGTAEFTVRNTGNVHLLINSIDIKGMDSKGNEVFAEQLGGWYLLGGASRRYSANIPKESCAGISKLKVEVDTNRTKLEGNLNADKKMCLP